MERTKAALIREIREGAKELIIFDKMRKLKTIKGKRIEEDLRQNFQETDTDLCDQCTADQRRKEDRTRRGARSRSVYPRLETRIEMGETREMTYRNVLNVRERPSPKVTGS